MGEVRAKVHLENANDLVLKATSKSRRRRVRSVDIDAVVDTGAVMMLLPQDVVEALGLERKQKMIVTLANGQNVELDVSSTLAITIAGRNWETDCLVGPPGCIPLIGQLVLERLDLVVDAVRQTLTVRPQSPFLPTLKLL